MRRLSHILIGMLLVVGGWVRTGAEILDEAGPDHPVLRPLADELDRVGVDVILGRSADFTPSDRPRLTPLEGFQTETGRDWASYWHDIWIDGFERGLIGAVVAVEKNQQAPSIEREIQRCRQVPAKAGDVTCDFLEAWLAAPRGKKVFVAFTRSDVDTALAVQAALRAQGYAAFVYLRENEQDPWAHPDFVGAVFANATHRLVIDTPRSRGSEGVKFEATCVQALMPTRQPLDTRWLEFIEPQ